MIFHQKWLEQTAYVVLMPLIRRLVFSLNDEVKVQTALQNSLSR